MSEFKIDKDVPIPEGAGKKSYKYPFSEMEVGDSFFTDVLREKLYPAASYYGKRNGKKFSIRKMEGGYRVWRIK